MPESFTSDTPSSGSGFSPIFETCLKKRRVVSFMMKSGLFLPVKDMDFLLEEEVVDVGLDQGRGAR